MAIQIVTDQIGSQQVTSTQIANNTITSSQINMNANYDFLGNIQANGAALATESYVQSAIAGLQWKEACKLATASALPDSSYSNGSSGVGATLTAGANGALSVDGVTVGANDRILVKNQGTGSENGIYKVTATGAADAAWVLTRTTDADTAAELHSAAVFVQQGSANSDIAFTQTVDNVTIGTTALVFTAFSGTEAITPGDGISKQGNTIALNLNGLASAVIAVSTDNIPFVDNAGNNKKESIVDLASAMAGAGISASSGQFSLTNNALTVTAGTGISGGGSVSLGGSTALNLDLNGLGSAAVDVAADSLAIIDATDNSSKKESLVDVFAAVAGAGISATSGVLSLTNNSVTVSAGTGLTGGGSVNLGGSITVNSDLNAFSALASVDMANDLLGAIDATDNSSKKLSIVNLASGLAGSGITAASGVLALTADQVTVSGGNGLSGGGAVNLGGSTSLALDLNELDGSANIDVGTDFIAFIDSGDSNASKKQSIGHLVTQLAGTGLTNSSGQMAISTNGVTAAELADNAVDTAAVNANAITADKLGARMFTESFAGSSSTTYDLARAVNANFADGVKVFRNGLRCRKVASGPADESEYTVAVTGGTGGVCRITFGAAPNTDTLIVDYLT